MLPTNVMSFMKKMVATDEAAHQTTDGGGGTFGKLRQTLSSSLLTAQDRVNKMSPRPSLIPDTAESPPPSALPEPVVTPTTSASTTAATPPSSTASSQKTEPGKPPSRAGACRVCLKSFKPEDFSKTCSDCQQRVCEDCASYSKQEESDEQSTWRCSVCRRKIASRACAIPQDSTDSLLDVPVLEALQRRHSDVKLGGTSGMGLGVPGTGSSGLAPPRSPELRRHSDVSPASLKELEKLKGSGAKTPGGDLDWRNRSGMRSGAGSRASSPPRRGEEFSIPPQRSPASRRQSIRMTKQHSYDEELKSAGGPAGAGMVSGRDGEGGLGLGLPAPIPRRASAYDVYAPGVLAAAARTAAEDRGPSPGGPRRASFRVAPDDTVPQKDSSPSPDGMPPSLLVEEDRRSRRRGSQLPDIAALRDRGAIPASVPWSAAALEDMEAPRRQASVDGEAIKIVIHDVDSTGPPIPVAAAKRRVVLRRDPGDKTHRTRGFGMRVVGGKTGADGRLFAYIVWTVPGGPADKGGLQQGDKVLEWGGVSLSDRTFEEVCAVMDRTGDVAELLVEHATDFCMRDLLEDPPGPRKGQQPPEHPGGLVIEADSESKTPTSPTRRKLPKTPEQIAREKQVSGRAQLQVWYHEERRELVVSMMAADDLAVRDDTLGHGSLPEAYAKLRIMPATGDGHVAQTEVAPASLNPIWNATLSFTGIPGEELMDRSIEVTLYDLCPQMDPVFLGECTVDLQKAFLDDRAVWYRLEDPRGLRGAPTIKNGHASPRPSIVGGQSLLMGGGADGSANRGRFAGQRSLDSDGDSIGDGLSLLHPDHAWVAGSRRGSSQSETLEVEVYQLNKDFSRSLPGSRRSSFQSQQEREAAAAAAAAGGAPAPAEPSEPASPATYCRDRRRSSCARVLRDPDEILRSLKAVKGELGRTMSLSVNKRASRRSSRARKESVIDIKESLGRAQSPPSDDETSGIPRPQVDLGPGQVQPKTGRAKYGELKLGLLMTKGVLEVEVIGARNLTTEDGEPPDTYVKCYLRDGERWLQKRKTRVARHSFEPIYKQTLRYQACDIIGRTLVVMVWQKSSGFEHNLGLGGAELSLDHLELTQHTAAWYPLFPIHTLGSDSNDSP